MKKKRRFITMAAIAVIVIFSVYQFINPPIAFKIDSRLVDINDTLIALSEEHGFDSATIYPSSSRTKQPELSDIIPSEVYDTAKWLDIQVIYFYNKPEPVGQRAVFVVDRLLLPRWYYRYNENSIFEEEVVPSVEEAVKQHRGAPYYGFCQKSEVPNWFFCANDSGG